MLLTLGILHAATRLNAAHSSATRGVVGGGIVSSRTDTIDYITIASEGNASDFGNLLEAKNSLGSTSSTTRGLFAGGTNGSVNLDVIEYITIGSTGNGSDFGNLLAGTSNYPAGAASNTRGFVCRWS